MNRHRTARRWFSRALPAPGAPAPGALAVAVLASVLAAAAPLAAQDQAPGVLLPAGVSPRERYTALTRYNLRRSENGRYRGHVYRQIRGTLRRADTQAGASTAGFGFAPPGSTPYTGTFFVFEQTRRDNRNVARRVDRSVPVRLAVLADGATSVPDDQAFPMRRGFPQFPREPVSIGESWEAPGELVVDPNWTGDYTRIGILAAYRYEGREPYQGRDVHRITAQYATRYRQGDDPGGDPALALVSGSHVSTILVDAETLNPVLIRDRIEEHYRYADGSSIGFRGFALTFYSTPVSLDRTDLVADIEQRLQEEQVQDVEVSEDEAGVRLSLRDIRFVANEATILPQERGRLDGIARALRSVPQRTFLVVGHTADIGLPDAQQELSVRRARTVVDELTARGIDADRLLFEGRGGTEPVAPNDTEEGRAQNRRVEILVLE
jgi:outer membrane protein OmpA-like peptidoglycan-associated protein